MGPSGNGLVERMKAGKPRGIKGVRMGAPVRLQKAVPRSKENAAVERREVNALRHWACAARRSSVTPRLSALRSLTFGEGRRPLAASEGKNNHGAPRARSTGAAKLCLVLAGCLKCESESDVRALQLCRGARASPICPESMFVMAGLVPAI